MRVGFGNDEVRGYGCLGGGRAVIKVIDEIFIFLFE